jgi:hypothetical protein
MIINMEMYIFRNGKEYGPFPLEKVKRFFADNKLKPDDKVWHEGLVDWVPVTRFPGIRPSLQKVSSSPLGQEDAPRRKVELYRRKVSLVVFVVLGFGLLAATLFLIQSDQSGPETTTASPSYLVKEESALERASGPETTSASPSYLVKEASALERANAWKLENGLSSTEDSGRLTEEQKYARAHNSISPGEFSSEKVKEESAPFEFPRRKGPAPELENGLSSTEDSGRLTEEQKYARAHNSMIRRQFEERTQRWLLERQIAETWIKRTGYPSPSISRRAAEARPLDRPPTWGQRLPTASESYQQHQRLLDYEKQKLNNQIDSLYKGWQYDRRY